MSNPFEINISSSSSSGSPTNITADYRRLRGSDSVTISTEATSGPANANVGSAQPDVYDIDEEASVSEIDLCDTELSEVDVEELPEDDLSFNWYRSRFPPAMRPIPVEEDPIIERMLGLRMNRASLSETFQSDIFARILEQVRSQAMIINRLSGYQIDTRPRILPSAILSKLVTRRITNASEAQALGSCPICLEVYTARMSVRILPGCGHLVHKPCMDKWISQTQKYTCPLDNLPITFPEPEVAISPVEIAEAAFPAGRQTRRQSNAPDRRSSRLRRRLG